MEDVKKILEKQLQLLSEVSENFNSYKAGVECLPKLSMAMVELARLLLGQSQHNREIEQQADAFHRAIDRAIKLSNLNQ